MNIIKTEMLMIAGNLESKADDAHMEHDDVRMTPREVHELADDIKAFVHESDRPTCQMVECTIDHGSRSWGMRCAACGKEFEHVKPGYGWHFCPNCGAMVTEKEE